MGRHGIGGGKEQRAGGIRVREKMRMIYDCEVTVHPGHDYSIIAILVEKVSSSFSAIFIFQSIIIFI